MLRDIELDLAQRVSLLRDYVKDGKPVRLATLGPSGTSSELAGLYLLQQLDPGGHELVLSETYEQASECVIRGTADLLLVANAFNGIGKFYMSPELFFICSYFHQTPLYGVAARKGFVFDHRRQYSVVTHHAPVSLIPWFLQSTPIRCDVVLASSTAAAARLVRDGSFDVCVTNAVAAELNGLEFVTRTRPIRMLWSVFRRNPAEASLNPELREARAEHEEPSL